MKHLLHENWVTRDIYNIVLCVATGWEKKLYGDSVNGHENLKKVRQLRLFYFYKESPFPKL